MTVFKCHKNPNPKHQQQNTPTTNTPISMWPISLQNWKEGRTHPDKRKTGALEMVWKTSRESWKLLFFQGSLKSSVSIPFRNSRKKLFLSGRTKVDGRSSTGDLAVARCCTQMTSGHFLSFLTEMQWMRL